MPWAAVAVGPLRDDLCGVDVLRLPPKALVDLIAQLVASECHTENRYSDDCERGRAGSSEAKSVAQVHGGVSRST